MVSHYIKMILKKRDWIYLAQDKDIGRLLWTQQWTIRFHTMWGISWPVKELQ